MAVSYTPTSDKLGDPDMVPRIGGTSAYRKDTQAEPLAVAETVAEVAEAAATAV